jgi:hypothetical protein
MAWTQRSFAFFLLSFGVCGFVGAVIPERDLDDDGDPGRNRMRIYFGLDMALTLSIWDYRDIVVRPLFDLQVAVKRKKKIWVSSEVWM